MSLNFGAASSYVQFSIGGAANVSNGAVTLVALWKPNFGGGVNSGIISALSSTTERRSFLMDTSALFGDGDFSSGVSITGSAGDWLWLAMSKPAGAAHYRMHWKNWTTGGAWTHTEAAGAGNHSDPGTSDNLKVGANPSTSSALGDVAVASILTSELADAAIQAACTSALADLIAAGPAWAVRFMNSAPTSIQDLIGSGNETSRSGTVTNSADPSGFSFDLGGAVEFGAARSRPFRSGPAGPNRFYQTPRSYDLAPTAQVTPETGTAAGGFAGQGVPVRVASTGGRAAIGFAGSGTPRKLQPDTGRSAIGVAGTGTDRKVQPDGGSAAGGFAGSGTDRKVQLDGGRAALGLAGQGVERKLQPDTGRAVVGLSGTGVAALTPPQPAQTGMGVLGLAGRGSARKVVAQGGRAVIGFAGRGAASAPAPPAQDAPMRWRIAAGGPRWEISQGRSGPLR